MFARPAVVAALAAAALLSTACVRGRNDGGRDAAGLSSNGAGPAPQPGPLAGQNTDTTLAPAGTPGAAPAGTAAPAPGAAAGVASPAAPATKAP